MYLCILTFSVCSTQTLNTLLYFNTDASGTRRFSCIYSTQSGSSSEVLFPLIFNLYQTNPNQHTFPPRPTCISWYDVNIYTIILIIIILSSLAYSPLPILIIKFTDHVFCIVHHPIMYSLTIHVPQHTPQYLSISSNVLIIYYVFCIMRHPIMYFTTMHLLYISVSFCILFYVFCTF